MLLIRVNSFSALVLLHAITYQFGLYPADLLIYVIVIFLCFKVIKTYFHFNSFSLFLIFLATSFDDITIINIIIDFY